MQDTKKQATAAIETTTKKASFLPSHEKIQTQLSDKHTVTRAVSGRQKVIPLQPQGWISKEKVDNDIQSFTKL